jgi:hypothetical protein
MTTSAARTLPGSSARPIGDGHDGCRPDLDNRHWVLKDGVILFQLEGMRDADHVG